MKSLLALTALIALCVSAYAEDAFQIDDLKRRCTIEQNSQLRERNGTPSCERLKAIGLPQPEQYYTGVRLPIEKTSPHKSLTNPVKTEELEYRWHSSMGKYCYFSKEDEVKACP
ncbi:hypothetical protein [Neisseria sp. CCUG12390]|uniref:hypothetical protein n=1 Tax=Neisseria sp. CCUG12390 TaxID=3392035 RepID=UPI003A0FF5EB